LQIALEEQRYNIDDHRVAGFAMLAYSLRGQGAHARVDDRFELFSARWDY
jgi:hypothetical protein